MNGCKIRNWKERSKTELTWRSPLRRRRSALDCRAIEEKAEEAEEEEEEEEEGEDALIPIFMTVTPRKLTL
jgi:hypothetical protein